MALERVFVCMAKLEKLTISKSKVKLMKLERTLKVMTQKYLQLNIYNWDETGLYFKLIPHSTYTAQNEERRQVRGTKTQKAKDIESHSLLALMPQKFTRFLWQ